MISSFELWQSELWSLQPLELGHVEMNISLPQLQYAFTISDRDVDTALKVSAFHVKIRLLRRQSTLPIAFRAKYYNVASTDP